ncbi:hypothetical protein TrVE_jg2117 [Triparma verrucosa]|uniref:DUF6817 domain-containing protein n=1 Tax=Triparma verrucosa TaxID=1606542 RepID=A0A9W7C607_9STRA|nr:hypothetical protein TrVE_jg2117 [Triparma verrucosa]
MSERKTLKVYLTKIGAFKTQHDRKSGRSLGQHLINTYDLLIKIECEEATALAGGLHSIYGTSVFTTMTVQPTDKSRALVAQTFGTYVEKLAFLFHILDRPKGLESGEARPRRSLDITVSKRELRDLRLIEAGNQLEQSPSMDLKKRFPAICKVWEDQKESRETRWAVGVVKSRWWHRVVRRYGSCAGGLSFGLKLLVGGENLFLPLPLDAISARRALLAASGLSDTDSNSVRFIIKGEAQYGMPPARIQMLSKFSSSACAGFALEQPWLPALPIEIVVKEAPVIEVELAPNEPIKVASLENDDESAGERILEAFSEQGFVVVDLGEAFAKAVGEAYAGTGKILEDLREIKKGERRLSFDGGRYCGYGSDVAREWVQVRSGVAEKFPWPSGTRAHVASLKTVHDTCNRVARAILSKILKALWADEAERPSIGSLLDAPGGEAEDAFGGSVQRFFRLKDNSRVVNYRSLPHADMGILTVAPRASNPALELVTPMGSTCRPEEILKDSECVVFAGETLAFLSRGKVQAPIHWVPVSNGVGGRCSAPFFLRASPNAVLNDEMTTREFCEKHAVGPRPWRCRKNGSRTDW